MPGAVRRVELASLACIVGSWRRPRALRTCPFTATTSTGTARAQGLFDHDRYEARLAAAGHADDDSARGDVVSREAELAERRVDREHHGAQPGPARHSRVEDGCVAVRGHGERCCLAADDQQGRTEKSDRQAHALRRRPAPRFPRAAEPVVASLGGAATGLYAVVISGVSLDSEGDVRPVTALQASPARCSCLRFPQNGPVAWGRADGRRLDGARGLQVRSFPKSTANWSPIRRLRQERGRMANADALLSRKNAAEDANSRACGEKTPRPSPIRRLRQKRRRMRGKRAFPPREPTATVRARGTP